MSNLAKSLPFLLSILTSYRFKTGEFGLKFYGTTIAVSLFRKNLSKEKNYAQETGKVAGANIAGVNLTYEGGIRVNSLNVFDKVYFSIGNVYDESKMIKKLKKMERLRCIILMGSE